MLSFKPLRQALLMGVATFGTTAAVGAIEQPAFAQEVTRTYNIQAQDLNSALREFALQTGRDVLYPPEIVAGKPSNGAQGQLTERQALEALLASTGLRFEQTASNGYAVQDPNSPTQLGAADAASSAHEEIVVTGTRIRGIAPVGSPVVSYDSEDIERSGRQNVQEFVRTIPQAYAGGSLGGSEDGVLGPGSGAILNGEAASGINLRGLGEKSTLVLLNGHRMAPSAFGSFADVSVIPIEAIDRVEVLSDGASSIYGSDAVAGVVNFRLRRDFSGFQTQVRYGDVTEGSSSDFLASQSAGWTWDTGNVFASLRYNSRESLSAADRSFTANLLPGNDILPDVERLTAFVGGHQDVTPNVTLFADVLWGRSDIERTFVPAVDQGIGTANESTNLNATPGIEFRLPSDWQAELSGTYSRVLTDSRFTRFDQGIPGYTIGDPASQRESVTQSIDLKFDGPLLELPAGWARLAIGGSHRNETFRNDVIYDGTFAETERDVSSVFGEIFVPVLSNAQAGDVRFTGSVRYDDYSDFGDTTNYKVGGEWEPVSSLVLRASYGTSFRAPSPDELVSQAGGQFIFNFPFLSPTGGPDVPVLILQGANPELRPETSTNYSVGFDFRPIDNFSFSLTYYDVDFRDRIITPPFDLAALLQPGTYGSLITPLADDSAAAQYLADAIANGATFIDFLGTGSDGVRFAYAGQQQNAAVVHQTGIDFSAAYSMDLYAGTLELRGSVAYIDRIDTSLSDDASSVNLLNQYATPLQLRARGDITWSNDLWTVNAGVNFANEYDDTSTSPPGTADADTTLDLFLRRQFADTSALRGLSVDLSVINVFDAAPPYVVGSPLTPAHYDVGNGNPLGRFVSLTLTKRW